MRRSKIFGVHCSRLRASPRRVLPVAELSEEGVRFARHGKAARASRTSRSHHR